MALGPYSLRTHLIFVVLGTVLPGALISGLIVRQTLEQNRSVLEHRLEDTARVDAAALDREFNGTIRVLQTLAQSPALDAGALKEFWNEAERAVRTQPGWYAVILLTPDGHQQVHTDVPFGEPLLEARETDSLRQLISTRKPAVGQLTPGRRDPKLRFPVRVPVERDGTIRYVLTALMEPESLNAVIRVRLPETEEWTRAIIDPGLQIAARSRGGDQMVGRPVTERGRALVRNPPARPIQGTSLEGEQLYSSLSRSDYGWTTAVSVPAAVLDGPVRASIIASVSGVAVLTLTGLLGVLMVSRRVSSDFEHARNAAAALAEGREPPSTQPQIAEAGDVQSSLQRAAQLLQQRARERDEQLQRAVVAQSQAEEANRTKDRFLAVLGHELRNPLAPAMTALELMKLRGGSTLQREREVLDRQISHMTRLVDDLLDASRLTRGKLELVKHRFELRVAVDRAVDMARPLIEQHTHAIYVGVPVTGLPIDGDQDRIVQVIVNLLTNAARYTPPGGHLSLTSEVVDETVEMTCEDDGPGIPVELAPTLFEPFPQGTRSIARQQGGLGLGLAIARSLTELHGGRVRYEAGHPTGSRFIVSLPLADAVASAEAPSTRGPELAVPPRRVLLVDDNVDALEMMRLALLAKGHSVATAPDGKSGLHVAAELQPDVAILDIGLPGIDGYELARLLRAEHPQVRLIALTGYGQDGDAAAARSAGFDAHCTKPVRVAALLEQIAALHAPSFVRPT